MQKTTEQIAGTTAKSKQAAAVAKSEALRTESVREVFDSGGVAVSADRESGLLRGVKLLGMRSRNGRVYTEKALRSAIGLYEGAKVNVNHPSGDPLAPRDYRDRIGVVRNIHLRPGLGLFGDMHCNPKHPLAEQLAWDAEHAPENVGMSHNVVARTRRDGSGLVVEAIQRVQSVDLVADPATTSGLFEHRDASEASESNALVEGSETAHTHRGEPNVEWHDELRDKVARLEEQVVQLQRKVLIESLLRRHRFGAPGEPGSITDSFVEELLIVPDESAVERLVEERAQERKDDISKQRVLSPESIERRAMPELGGINRDALPFVQAITRR